VNRPILLTTLATATLMHGCATSTHSVAALGAQAPADAVPINSSATGTSPVATITLAQAGQPVVHGKEIGAQKDKPDIEGHPLTSVVVTQCNLVVAVYMTMPDGRLLRFDSKADVPAADLVSIAYTATRSERVEVACEGLGAAGFETHGPV
jgi:hypothetical protein